MGNLGLGGFVAGLLGMALVLVGTGASADDTAKPPVSPRAFVAPESCSTQAPCPPGYWVFRAPDCQYYNVRHSPGVVLLFESGKTLQCRCRLVWLLTKGGEPPTAKVSCKWVDLDDAWLSEH